LKFNFDVVLVLASHFQTDAFGMVDDVLNDLGIVSI